MKIRLLQDLPIDKKCGAIKDAVFEVIEEGTAGRNRILYFEGIDGQRCGVYFYECEVVNG